VKWIIFLFVTCLILLIVAGVIIPQVTLKIASHKKSSGKTVMTISSSAFKNGASIPSQYTCDGADVNPPLAFSGIPKDTKSLLLLVDDPDAPGGTWHHWTIYNMSPETVGLAENSKPSSGHEGITSFGKIGYGGPCPPSSIHGYVFTLYALDSMLDLPSNATYNEIRSVMDIYIIDKAELIGKYSRVK